MEGMLNYAIEEYEKGISLRNSGIIKIQIATIYADIFKNNKNNNLEILRKGLNYLNNIDEDDEKIEAECFFTKGCLYGMLGENCNNKNKKTFLKKSCECFEQACKIHEDYHYYNNAAISYLYLKDEKNLLANIKKAKELTIINEVNNFQSIDIMRVFNKAEKKMISKKIMNEIDNL